MYFMNLLNPAGTQNAHNVEQSSNEYKDITLSPRLDSHLDSVELNDKFFIDELESVIKANNDRKSTLVDSIKPAFLKKKKKKNKPCIYRSSSMHTVTTASRQALFHPQWHEAVHDPSHPESKCALYRAP